MDHRMLNLLIMATATASFITSNSNADTNFLCLLQQWLHAKLVSDVLQRQFETKQHFQNPKQQ